MMDNQLELPEEFLRSQERLHKADARSLSQEGWGATTGGKALTQRYHERLSEAISVSLLGSYGGSDVARLVPALRKLTADAIALNVLQTMLHSIGLQHPLRNTLLKLGHNIADELWAAGIIKAQPQLAAQILDAVKRRYAGSKRRVSAARRAALKAGYSSRDWSTTHAIKAGAFLWNIVSTSLPDVFELVNYPGTDEFAISLTDDAEAVVSGSLDKVIIANPVFWPSELPPKPWDASTGGGSHDPRVNSVTTVVRSRHKSTQAAVRHAIRAGTMKPALDAINRLQDVAFKINPKVLEVLEACRGLEVGTVPGFPGKTLPTPVKASASKWARMSKRDKAISGAKRDAVRVHNNGLVSDRVQFQMDMVTANAMAQLDRFYTPMNFDWRGRVYALCHLNFQREDRVRALFMFANGLPVGTEGLRWLKIHTANCGDFTKISKRPLEERVQWCNDNTRLITSIASAPLVHTEWMQAGEPFLFLAACFELSAAWEQGPSFMTHLPTSYDGSCSGLQHLSAMTRASEGEMVNLTPSPLPQDVYQRVADDTFANIAGDTENAELAKLFLEFDGDRRSLVKRNVMTYSYSSKKFGMSSQQQVDLMDPLSREVLSGKREEHPFVGYQMGTLERPSKGARFIASHIFDAIETRIHLPAQAMKFLQGIAKAMAHEGKPVQWTTPVGLPWINRYHEPIIERVKLLIRDGSVKRQTKVSVATGDLKEIDKAKAANGVAPNFVHALDASHLLLVANASAREGIRSIATVHDSFGCLAPQAAQFNQIIRAEFALMYETHDVLAEIHERAFADLTHANQNRLPPLLPYGNLNLKDILNADFAFA
jgi:DNA-directed RNA polymerase, mitochondrial